MEINVIIVPETEEFINPVLKDNRVWINKNLGKPMLEERNAKYIAPYWLGGLSIERGINRIYHILGLTETDDSYEIKLGNSFYLSQNWLGPEDLARFRRFQYMPLSKFGLMESSKGILMPIEKNEIIKYKIQDIDDSFPLITGPNLSPRAAISEKFFAEFWIGKNLDPTKYWEALYAGEGYRKKFFESETYILEISFLGKPKDVPLFNYEPVIKTVKALHYHVKDVYLTKEEFNSEGPLYLQEINRGSEIITFLTTITGIMLGYILIIEKIRKTQAETELLQKKAEAQETLNKLNKKKLVGQEMNNDYIRSKLIGQQLENWDKAHEMFKKHNPTAYEAYVNGKFPKKLRVAIDNMMNEGLGKVRVSKSAINGKDIDIAKNDLDELNS